MSKVYKEILPIENKLIRVEFGWVPVSVIDPQKQNSNKWKSVAYLNDGVVEKRRSDDAKYLAGLENSEFNAEVAEIVVRYWSLEGSTIVDPFAGRATRAVISSKLGRNYTGYDISPKTVERVKQHLLKHDITNVTIHLANGTELEHTQDDSVDLVFTCPPYYNIEKYESVPGQLSDYKQYEFFLDRMRICFNNIYRVLKPGAFMCMVVGDFRTSEGFHLFHADCIEYIKKSGLIMHDVVIIKNNSPFQSMMTGKVAAKRYTAKTHEYILVARKPGEYDYSWYNPENNIKKNSFWE